MYIFLVGSCAGTATTLCFLYVLLRFPSFIRHVKAGGAEPDVVVRLATFYQLNVGPTLFRSLSCLNFEYSLFVSCFAFSSRFLSSSLLLMLSSLHHGLSGICEFLPRCTSQPLLTGHFSSFALDFLLMLGGFGCFVSSGITLLVSCFVSSGGPPHSAQSAPRYFSLAL